MKVKLTIVESKCRSGYFKEGQEFIVEDLCPPICHELWQGIYPSVYTLLNNGDLDYGNVREKRFTYRCPDQGRVLIKGEVVPEQHPSVDKMWEDYLTSIGESLEETDKTYEAWHFCNNEKDANELAELVLSGQKYATASLECLYKLDGDKVPEVGDLSVIIDWDGKAKCICQIKDLQSVPFNEVKAEFAYKEGEGDRSLAHWQRVHEKYFKDELSYYNKSFDKKMKVLCEEFEVVYKEDEK